MQQQKFLRPFSVFVLLIGVCSAFKAGASELLSGTIFLKKNGYYLNALIPPARDTRTFLIVPRNASLRETLSRLETGDFLSGAFEYNPKQNSYWLETIESVGLRSLLGSWYEQEALFRFDSFNHLTVLSSSLISESGFTAGRIRTKDYNYSISPSPGHQAWVAFLSDRNSTYYSTIQTEDTQVRIRIYDTDTGVLLRVHNLTRLNSNVKPFAHSLPLFSSKAEEKVPSRITLQPETKDSVSLPVQLKNHPESKN